MPRQTNRLSAVGVQRVAKAGRYADGGGLYLRVSPALARSWVFRWVRGKNPDGKAKETEMGLGAFPAVSLADARALAVECRRHLAAGRDPKVERDREKEAARDFGSAADEYLKAMRSKWAPKTARQSEHSLTVECKPIRGLPVAEIDTADVLRVLKPIWQEKNVTAVKVRYRIEAVLDYAKANGWRDADNPARWRGHLKNLLPARTAPVAHRPAMPYSEIPAFMASLAEREAVAARAMEFLVLTACRSGEVLKATWDEIDLVGQVWTIPGGRMKAKKGHRVPLTPAMLAILVPLHDNQISQFVFPGNRPNRPLSGMALAMLMRRMNIEDATPHGFRSAFRDWCGDETSFPREIAEAALAHRLGDSVELAYRRSDALDRRRQLMTAWCDYCTGQEGAGKVVALHAS